MAEQQGSTSLPRYVSRLFKDLRASAQIRFYKVRGAIFYKKSDIDRLVEKGRVV